MTLFMIIACISGILPPPESIPLMTAGETRTVTLTEGTAWVRILEQDFTFLRVSSDPASDLTAFDEDENALASSTRGGLVLSAFNDYWFFVRITGTAGSRTTVSVDEKAPVRMSGTAGQSGAVSSNEMGEAFRFIPPREGQWRFDLEGGSSTDLDLEVYGTGMDLWAGSYGNEGEETTDVCAMPSETLTVIVSRYNKAGDGTFSLTATRTGSFPTMSGSRTGTLDGNHSIARFLVDPSLLRRFLNLGSPSGSGDIDLVLYDREGEYLAGSSSYSAREALLLPVGGEGFIAEIRAYDFGDSDRIRYQLDLMDGLEAFPGNGLDTLISLSSTHSSVIGITTPGSSILEIRAEFEKTRNGDFTVFRSDGPPVVSLSTARGDERLALWLEGGDTLWVNPCFLGDVSESTCRLRISPIQPATLDGNARGNLSPGAPAAFYQVRSRADAVLSIKLQGDARETDFDLFVSGPGVDRMAQGGISSADAAGDEEISFHCPEAGTYVVTVYTYERAGEGSFSISSENIPREPLAQAGGPGEIWAVIAGISGYPSAADVLERASMDALDFYRFIVLDQGVDPDHVILLVDGMATADAFREAVMDARSRAGAGDRLVVFFSGHGDQRAPGSGGEEEPDTANESICLYDGDIEDDWLAGRLSNQEESVVLLLDACFSGGFVNDFEDDSNVLVLTAAREDLSVSERILTPILLDGSRGGADSDGDGGITARELADFVDARLQLVCPVCDATIDPRTSVCPECGAVLKGDNRVPRPEQGVFLDPDLVLWTCGVTSNGR